MRLLQLDLPAQKKLDFKKAEFYYLALSQQTVDKTSLIYCAIVRYLQIFIIPTYNKYAPL